MNGWVIFLVLLALYGGLVFYLRSRPKPLPYNLEVNGPLLFWRTQFGKTAIQKVARPKAFWNVVADIGIVLTWLCGIAVFALLILSLVQYFISPKEVAANSPPPEFLIGLPGVNPLIPVGYGLLALVVALVIHEGSHGVMAYVGNMRVKSLGLVALIVPIGAFVEPDDEDLAKSTARAKNRVFAAGPTSNLVLALVCGALLSMVFLSAVTPVNGGNGVVVGSVEPTSAADVAGLHEGDLLTSVRGTTLTNQASYIETMNSTLPGERLSIVYLRGGELHNTTAVLGNKYDYVQRVNPSQNKEEYKQKGFLGVSGIGLGGLTGIKDTLQHPFHSFGDFFLYIGYPFFVFSQGIDVLASPYNALFTISGPLAGIPMPIFFGVATFLYWVVWINLMLGTFNALPAGPLDGGQMFRATLVDRLMRRHGVTKDHVTVERAEMGGMRVMGKDPETQAKLDKINGTVSRVTMSIGFFILGLILLPLIAPPLIRLFTG